MNPNRRFMVEVLNRGLDLEMISPDDMLAHVTPEVLAHHLPIALKAKLLQASLNSERMTPSLVVEVVGVEALVEHTPLPILWACVRACAGRQLQGRADDGFGASLGTGSGAIAIAAATAGGDGSGVVAPLAAASSSDDPPSRPFKSTRPPAPRAGSSLPRFSALPPRGQTPRRGPEATPAPATGSSFEVSRSDDSSPDFEIVEETEVPSRQRLGRITMEDDSRPGGKP